MKGAEKSIWDRCGDGPIVAAIPMSPETAPRPSPPPPSAKPFLALMIPPLICTVLPAIPGLKESAALVALLLVVSILGSLLVGWRAARRVLWNPGMDRAAQAWMTLLLTVVFGVASFAACFLGCAVSLSATS